MPNQDEMRFLSWSIGSRHETQEQALRLLKLMEQHSKAASKHKIRMRVLVAVSFALWRAAFLADRKGLVDVTFSASKAFLSKMLTDNAITFNVDWTQRDWSFRFYADAARQNLKRLEAHWPNFKVRVRGKSQEQWDCLQQSFEAAIDCLESDLERERNKKNRKN